MLSVPNHQLTPWNKSVCILLVPFLWRTVTNTIFRQHPSEFTPAHGANSVVLAFLCSHQPTRALILVSSRRSVPIDCTLGSDQESQPSAPAHRRLPTAGGNQTTVHTAALRVVSSLSWPLSAKLGFFSWLAPFSLLSLFSVNMGDSAHQGPFLQTEVQTYVYFPPFFHEKICFSSKSSVIWIPLLYYLLWNCLLVQTLDLQGLKHSSYNPAQVSPLRNPLFVYVPLNAVYHHPIPLLFTAKLLGKVFAIFSPLLLIVFPFRTPLRWVSHLLSPASLVGWIADDLRSTVNLHEFFSHLITKSFFLSFFPSSLTLLFSVSFPLLLFLLIFFCIWFSHKFFQQCVIAMPTMQRRQTQLG